MNQENVWDKYEKACKEHSNKCEKMLLFALSLFLSLIAADVEAVRKILNNINLWFYIGYFGFIACFIYSYYTFLDNVVYWHRQYENAFKCNDQNVKKSCDNKDCASLWRNFRVQVFSLFVLYTVLIWAVLLKFDKNLVKNLDDTIVWLAWGTMALIHMRWIYFVVSTLFLVLIKYPIEDYCQKWRESKE